MATKPAAFGDVNVFDFRRSAANEPPQHRAEQGGEPWAATAELPGEERRRGDGVCGAMQFSSLN